MVRGEVVGGGGGGGDGEVKKWYDGRVVWLDFRGGKQFFVGWGGGAGRRG